MDIITIIFHLIFKPTSMATSFFIKDNVNIRATNIIAIIDKNNKITHSITFYHMVYSVIRVTV